MTQAKKVKVRRNDAEDWEMCPEFVVLSGFVVVVSPETQASARSREEGTTQVARS